MATSTPPQPTLLPKHSTLPRQLLKWIQGLDLSYSVKDFRRDLKNGFLIAQIFSRYHPGKIQMHSFDNSQNSQRKRNNWALIALFLEKNEIPIAGKEFDRIEHGDSEQLYEFMCRVYTTLTQRKLSLQQLQETGQSFRNDNLTSSFLMKPSGIEKLEGSINNSMLQEEELEQTLQKETNQVKKPNLLKIPSKQITPNIDNNDSSVNMKSVSIRQVNEKTGGEVVEGQASRREASTVKKDSHEEEQERSVMNYLNDIIEGNLENEEYKADKLLFDSRYSNSMNFVRKINMVNSEMVCLFFEQVIASKQGLTLKIFKQEQETWKFHVFMKSCLHQLDVAHPAFHVLLQLLFEYVSKGEEKQKQRHLSKQFMNQYWYPLFIKQIKLTTDPSKRSKFIKLLSKVTIDEPDRKQLITQFRQTANNITLFMQFLSILIQAEKFEESSRSLIDIYINYANLHLFSNCKSLRAYSLKIYMKICSENFVFGLKTFKPHYEELSKIEDWENMSQVILILGILLTRVTESKEYMNLVKQPTSLSRTYNPENEKMASQMRDEIENISNLIYSCSLHCSHVVRKIALDVAVPLMDVHPVLGKVFLTIYLAQSKEQQQETIGESKNIEVVAKSKTQLEVRNVGRQELVRVGVDIIGAVNEHLRNKEKTVDQSIFQLLLLSLQTIDDKDIKASYPEDRIERVLSELFTILVQKSKDSPMQQTAHLIDILSGYHFQNHVKIRKHDQLYSELVISNIAKPQWSQHFTEKFGELAAEYGRKFNPLVKEFAEHFKVEIVNSKDTRLNELARVVEMEVGEREREG